MEVLHVLEEKVAQLVQVKKQDNERIEQLKREKLALQEEIKRLVGEVQRMESTLLASTKSSKDLDDEREMTRMAVDDLIQNIDALLNKELQA